MSNTKLLTIAFMPVVVAFMLYAALVMWVPRAHGQEVLPEENLLVLACNHMNVVGVQENVRIINCRQDRPIEVNGNIAAVHIRVRAVSGVFKFSLYYQRTPWSIDGIANEP